MERKFGVDLSGVQSFTGRKAMEASGALGAEAFTYGKKIAFASESPSKETVAHEVAHIIQQSKDSSSSEQHEEEEASLTEKSTITPLYMSSQFTGKGLTVKNKRLRFKLTSKEKNVLKKLQNESVKGMAMANSIHRDVEYPSIPVNTGHGFANYEFGYLPPKYWEQVKEGGKPVPWTFRLKKGKSASDAVDAAFNGPTRVECLAMAKMGSYLEVCEKGQSLMDPDDDNGIGIIGFFLAPHSLLHLKDFSFRILKTKKEIKVAFATSVFFNNMEIKNGVEIGFQSIENILIHGNQHVDGKDASLDFVFIPSKGMSASIFSAPLEIKLKLKKSVKIKLP